MRNSIGKHYQTKKKKFVKPKKVGKKNAGPNQIKRRRKAERKRTKKKIIKSKTDRARASITLVSHPSKFPSRCEFWRFLLSASYIIHFI